MTKKSDAPAIRFKGFSDAWEQRKAIDIADYSKGNGYSKGDLTDVGTPIILYGRLYTKYQFAISEVDTFAVPRNGAVYSQGNEVIVPASGETAEDIARASAVEKSGVLLGGDLNILKPFDFINPLFLALAISNGEPQKELAKKAQGKSVVHIHNTDIQEVTIAYPSNTEQDRIVSVFRQLDNLITLHQRKFEKLTNVKKSMLEKMFPQNGSSYPEIRFKGFTDPWEQRKLSEMCGTFEYGLNAAAKEFDGKNKYIRITDIDDASREFLLSDLSSPDICLDGMSKYLLSSGDVVFARTGASVGKTYIYRENDGIVYFAGFLIRAKVNQDNDAEFVFQSTLSPSYEKYIRITSQRSGQPGVNAQEYSEYDLFAPSKEEQQRIGHFLRGIDNLITLHQRQPFLHSPPDISLIVQLTPPFFTFSWEQRKLGELVDVCSGRDYKHLSEGTIPVYGTGGYMLSVNDALSYDRDAIGIGRKGTIDRPYILKAPFWTVDTLFYAIPREKADLNFAFDIFQNIDWKKKDESTGVPSLSKTAINDIDVLAPKHGEQQTIGQFFAAIDHLITLHQRQTIVYAVIRSIRKVILAERQYFAPPMVRKSP